MTSIRFLVNKSFLKKSSFVFGLILLLVILLLASADFSIEPMSAASADNVSGWAWSENIGWISFNSTNCDTDDDGDSDGGPGCPTAGSPMEKYGVDVDGAGNFSGFAWSENIGWIGFNPASVLSCPGGVCQANVDPVTGIVIGWARACAVFPEGVCSGALRPNAERGNWEGWISLSCDNTGACGASDYKISYNNITNEFEGWAWAGGNVSDDEASVGWISFNKLNCDAVPLPPGCPPGPLPDYKVTMLWGNPPQAQANCECPVGSTGCDSLTCTAYAPNHSTFGPGVILNANGSCDLEDCDCAAGGFPAAVPCNLTCDWSEGGGAWSSVGCANQLFAPGQGVFNAILTVVDLNGRDDTDNLTVNLLRDAWANFECCYGEDKANAFGSAECIADPSTCCQEADWQDCTSVKFEIGTDKIWLRADRPGGGLSRESDGAVLLVDGDYTWSFPAEVFFPLESPGDPLTTDAVVGWFYVVALQADITLDVTDSVGRVDTLIQTLDAKFPMPAWYED